MFGGMDAQAGPMLKQMKALGIKAKFISGDGAQSAELIKLGGDAAEGSTTAGLPKEKMPQAPPSTTSSGQSSMLTFRFHAPFTRSPTRPTCLSPPSRRLVPIRPRSSTPSRQTSMDGVTGKIAFDDKGRHQGRRRDRVHGQRRQMGNR